MNTDQKILRIRFCPYAGKCGSSKTCTLKYFTQCWVKLIKKCINCVFKMFTICFNVIYKYTSIFIRNQANALEANYMTGLLDSNLFPISIHPKFSNMFMVIFQFLFINMIHPFRDTRPYWILNLSAAPVWDFTPYWDCCLTMRISWISLIHDYLRICFYLRIRCFLINLPLLIFIQSQRKKSCNYD